MDELPIQPGTYALILELSAPQDLQIGRLGRFHFPAGVYVYLGSARGPGGIRARLGRHLRGGTKTRWHIDYLRASARVAGYGFQVQDASQKTAIHLECQWSQEMVKLPSAVTLVKKFGASDCDSGCQAHLVFLSGWEDIEDFDGLPIRDNLGGF